MVVKPKCEKWINGVCYVAGQDAPFTETKSEVKPKKAKNKPKTDEGVDDALFN